MSFLFSVILVAIIEFIIICVLIFILVKVAKWKRQQRINAYNERQKNVEVFKKKIREKGEAVEKAIKESSSTDDYINIYNDIMQDDPDIYRKK